MTVKRPINTPHPQKQTETANTEVTDKTVPNASRSVNNLRQPAAGSSVSGVHLFMRTLSHKA